MATDEPSINMMTKAQQYFTVTEPLYQTLIKRIMEIERDKAFQNTRSNIHLSLVREIKDVIK